MQNIKISGIAEQLRCLQKGGNWLEENFNKKLQSLDTDDAFRQPIPGVHSVAEIVWHCIYWHRVNIQRMTGNPGFRDATIDEQNFLPLGKLREVGWLPLLDDLDKSFSDLQAVIQDRDDSFLDREYEPGKCFSFILYGTIEHDAYHLGQIGLVLKILNSYQ